MLSVIFLRLIITKVKKCTIQSSNLWSKLLYFQKQFQNLSTQWLEMFWWCNDFTIWRFPTNTTSHSKIYCCRRNQRLPQSIKSVAICKETSTVSKYESCIVERPVCWWFSKELLTIGNGRVPVDESSGLIAFP